jgi:hypothetical protein
MVTTLPRYASKFESTSQTESGFSADEAEEMRDIVSNNARFGKNDLDIAVIVRIWL